jgi:hypothetical protein
MLVTYAFTLHSPYLVFSYSIYVLDLHLKFLLTRMIDLFARTLDLIFVNI